MRVSWLFGALVTFIIGFALTATIFGAVVGLPLIALSIFLLVVAFILPQKK